MGKSGDSVREMRHQKLVDEGGHDDALRCVFLDQKKIQHRPVGNASIAADAADVANDDASTPVSRKMPRLIVIIRVQYARGAMRIEIFDGNIKNTGDPVQQLH